LVSQAPSSRTRASGFAGTSTTRSLAATSCCASRCPTPSAPSTVQARSDQPATHPPTWQPGARTRGRPARRGIAHVGKGGRPSLVEEAKVPRPPPRTASRWPEPAYGSRPVPPRAGCGAIQDHHSQQLSKNHIQTRFHPPAVPASHPAKHGKTQPEQAVLCTRASPGSPPATSARFGVRRER
jgi:hypothetical protein